MLKILWMIFGVLFLTLGIIGIFLPLLPTTPFVLLAAALFAKSSQTLYDYLANSRYFGPIIVSWQETRTIPPRAKLISGVVMGISMTISAIYWLS